MFGPYLDVLRLPGAARFSAAGALARMQMSMSGVGAVLLISDVRGSYGLAGAVSATFAISAAVAGPVVSRLIDSRGQRRVVPWQLALHLPALAAMIGFGVFTQLTWPILVLAVLAGAGVPSVGTLVRARWSKLLSGTPMLRTAFAWESLIDEMVFILGPVLATVLALQLFPSAALVFAAIFLTVGLVFLLSQVRTEPVPSGASHRSAGRPALLLPGVAGVALVFLLLGGVFGSLEVATVATTKEAGAPGTAGIMLALYSVGSLLSGLVFGVLELRASLLRQFVFSTAALAVVSLPLTFLDSMWLLGGGLFVAGLAAAPALISGMSLLQRLVPADRLTESLSWANSGMAVGLAISMPAAGYISDHAPAQQSYWVLSGCAIGAFVVVLAVLGSLRRAQQSSEDRIAFAALTGKPELAAL